jgi:CRISPR-associated RAMP protein (TIGR02581 family)
MSWVSHSKILRSIEIQVKYEALTPLRIGAAKGKTPTSPVDLQVLKLSIGDLRDVPYIPGSSLKGVFRTTAGKLALSRGLNVCYAGEGCKEKFDNSLKLKYYEILQNAVETGVEEKIVEVLSSKYCLICRLFGTASYSSHIRISDAYPSQSEIPSTSVKTGIAIERRSGGAKTNALYQVEFVNPGAKFYGSIILHNFPNYGIGLLAEILEQINKGYIKIGGFKSRGFGSVRITIESLKGIVKSGEEFVNINNVKELEPLDDQDEKISFDPSNPQSLLSNSKVAWINYCDKIRK